MKNRNSNFLKQLNKIFIIFAFAVLIINVPTPERKMFANVQFKKHDSQSKSRLEINIKDANEEDDKAEWDRIVQSSKEVLLAEWEQDADKKITDALLEEEDKSLKRVQLEEDKQVAKAEWEKSADMQISIARGVWFASRQNITYSDFNKDVLTESIKAADSAVDSEVELSDKVATWDNIVNNTVSSINTDFEKQLDLDFEDAFTISDSILNEQEKEAYLKTIEQMQQLFRIRYKHERNSIVYLGRNTLIAELFFDQDSLKAESEADSATAVTENIISETLEDLEEEEKKILNRDTDDKEEGAGSVDFSQLGENWEEDIRKLIDNGLQKWGTAQDNLLGQMMLWKNNSEQSFKDGNKKWENAFRSLKEAEETWLNNISTEIETALDNWEAQQNEFNTNMTKAKQDFANYVEVTRAEWQDHSAGLKNMAVSGSDAYKDAVDNINWLGDMAFEFRKKAELENKETFSIIGKKSANLSIAGSDSLFSAGKGYISLSSNAATSINTYAQQFADQAFTNKLMGWQEEVTYKTEYVNNIPKQVVDTKTNVFKEYTGATLSNISVTPTLLTSYYDPVTKSVKEEYSMNFKATGSYISGTKQIFVSYHQSSGPKYREENVYSDIEYNVSGIKFTREAKLDVNDKYKATGNVASYVFYAKEKQRWESIKQNFSEIIEDSELYMHSKNMQGTDNGPGFLTNSDGKQELKYENGELEKDPYLMTTAEVNYELARKNKQYYEKRLEVAKAVHDYAYPTGAGAKRESKAVTEKRLEDTKLALYGEDTDGDGLGDGGAKGDYDAALLNVDNIVKKMKNIQSGAKISDTEPGDYNEDTSLAGLTKALEEAKTALEAAREEYQVHNKALILLSSGQTEVMKEMLLKEIEDLEKGLVYANKEFNEKQETYYTKMLEYNKIDRLSQYATVLEDVIKKRELSKVTFENLKTVVTGEETEANLESWFVALKDKKDSIWQASELDSFNKIDYYYNNWQTKKADAEATAEDKEIALNTYKQVLKEEYYNKELKLQVYDKQLDLLLDKDFIVKNYFSQESSEQRNKSQYQKFANRNKQVIDLISQQIAAIPEEEFSYDKLKTALETNANSNKFSYGISDANYENYVIANAAYNYVVTNFSALTQDEAGLIKEFITEEIQIADLIYNELYLADDFETKLATFTAEANAGDKVKQAVLREHYLAGSMLSSIAFVSQFDIKENTEINKNSIVDNFIEENYQKFVSNELAESIAWQKQMTGEPADGSFYDILDYSKNWDESNEDRQAIENYGSDVDFLTMNISSLKSYVMTFDGYLKDGLLKDKTISKPVKQLIDEATNLKNQIEIYEYVKANYSVISSADIDAAKAEFENVQAALIFTENFQSNFTNPGVTTSGKITALIEEFDKLSAAEKAYINTDLVTTIETLKTKEKEQRLYKLSSQFIGSELDVDTFIQVEGSDLTDEDKVTLKDYLKPFAAKKAYHKAEKLEPALLDYLTTVELDTELEAEMREYIQVDYFLDMHANGVDTYLNVKDEYKDYAKFYHLQDLAKNSKDDYEAAADKSAFIDTMVNNFCTLDETKGYANTDFKTEYTEFVNKFYNDEIIAASYLPQTLQNFVAASNYYDEYYYDGKVLEDEAALDEYFLTNYKNKGFDDSVKNELLKYVNNINLIDEYYGGSLKDYVENNSLTADEEKTINRYYYLSNYNGIEDSLMPGLYVGTFELENQIQDDLLLTGSIAEEIYSSLEDKLTDILISVDNQLDEKILDITKKETALEFKNDPDTFKNYRNSLMNVAVKSGDDFAGLTVSATTSYSYDEKNNEGETTSFRSGANTQAGSLDSNIFETAGKLADKLALLKKITSIDKTAYEASDDFRKDSGFEVYSISSFIDSLKNEYDKTASLTTDVAASSVELNNNMQQLFGNINSAKTVLADEINAAKNEMTNQELLHNDLAAKLIDQRRSRDIISNTDVDKSKSNVNIAGDDLEIKEEIYNNALADLEARQQEYQTLHEKYIADMNSISTSYNEYKAKEFEFEKANAIYEYANTPYLKDTAQHDTELLDTEGVEGQQVNLEEDQLPDAKERLETAQKEYDAAVESFTKSETVKNGDSSKLSEDTVYQQIRTNYINKTDSYIRTDRAKNIIVEELGMLEKMQQVASDNYNLAKLNLGIFNVPDKEGDALLTGQITYKQRDEMLARILGNSTKAQATVKAQQFVDNVYNYHCKLLNAHYVAKYAKDYADALAAYDQKLADYNAKMADPNRDPNLGNYLKPPVKPKYSDTVDKWENHKLKITKAGMDKYNALDAQTQSDIQFIYNNHVASKARSEDGNDENNKGNASLNLIEIVQARFDDVHADYRYDYYNDKYHSTSKARYKSKRNAKKNRNKWENKRNQARKKYLGTDSYAGLQKQLIAQLEKISETKRVYGRMSDQTKNVGYVRYVNNAVRIHNVEDQTINSRTVNDVFKSSTDKYALGAKELNNLYDSQLIKYNEDNNIAFKIDENSINIGTARKQVAREDLDGKHLKANIQKIDGVKYVVVLDSNGTATTEKYLATDLSVVLKNANGDNVNAADMQLGASYKLYDNIYKVTEVMNLISSSYDTQRQNAKTKYNDYAKSAEQSYALDPTKGHDRVHLLRDQEQMYWNMLENTTGLKSDWNAIDAKAVVEGDIIYTLTEDGDRTGNFYNKRDVNGVDFKLINDSRLIKTISEDRIRGYNGYKTLLNELVYNDKFGADDSVGTQIVEEMLKQNTALQNQLWAQQQKTFNEKKQSWNQSVGYILNRGKRDWQHQLDSFTAKWMRWRIETRKEIETGEDEWVAKVNGFQNDKAKWQKEVSDASTEESVQKLYDSIGQRLSNYDSALSGNLVKNIDNVIDIDTLKEEILSSQPVSLGVFNNSMNSIDTTVGFASMLQLGLDNTLSSRYDKAMDDFEDSMTIVQNLKMSEVIFKTLEGFNERLKASNEGMYANIGDGVYGSKLSRAIYRRDKATNKWIIRYVKENNLIGGIKYGYEKVEDYRKYETDIVKIDPINNGKGGEIDFRDATTFAMLDADEIEIMVQMQLKMLNNQIDLVFGKEGEDNTIDEADISSFKTGKKTVKGGADYSFIYHRTAEQKRLFGGKGFDGELAKGYEKWWYGQKQLETAGYNRPMFSGGPSSKQVAQIAATIACSSQPWLAFAVNAAFTSTDVAMGDLHWKHAAVQLGVSAAAAGAGELANQFAGKAYVALASTGVNMMGSGIRYDEDGRMGWSDDQFKAGIKSGAVDLAISYGTKSYVGDSALRQGLVTGLSSGFTSSLDFETTDWWKIGFDDDKDWKDSAMIGASAAAASWVASDIQSRLEIGSDASGRFSTSDYTNKMIRNGVESGIMSAYNMARYGMTFDESMKETNFWGGMTYGINDLGGFLGHKAVRGVADHYGTKKATAAAMKELGHDTDSEGNKIEDVSDQEMSQARTNYIKQKIAKAQRASQKGSSQTPEDPFGFEGIINALGAGLIGAKNAIAGWFGGGDDVMPDAEPGAGSDRNVYEFLHDIYGGQIGGDWDNAVASSTLRQLAGMYGLTTDEYKQAFAQGLVGNEHGANTAKVLGANINLAGAVGDYNNRQSAGITGAGDYKYMQWYADNDITKAHQYKYASWYDNSADIKPDKDWLDHTKDFGQGLLDTLPTMQTLEDINDKMFDLGIDTTLGMNGLYVFGKMNYEIATTAYGIGKDIYNQGASEYFGDKFDAAVDFAKDNPARIAGNVTGAIVQALLFKKVSNKFSGLSKYNNLDDVSLGGNTKYYNSNGHKAVNPWKSTMNCGGCAQAGDARIAGRPATALPTVGDFNNGFTVRDMQNVYKSKFLPTEGIDDIVNIMSESGQGSRGIVFGYRGKDKIGHFFNVFNSKNKVNFYDFQVGGFPNVNGYEKFYLMFTNRK